MLKNQIVYCLLRNCMVLHSNLVYKSSFFFFSFREKFKSRFNEMRLRKGIGTF